MNVFLENRSNETRWAVFYNLTDSAGVAKEGEEQCFLKA
jgi:hypothetical protein